MTFIHGQIGTLKKIRETLDQEGISRFNSVADINKFLKNFNNEKEELFFTIERNFELELDTLQVEGFHLQKNYDLLKTKTEIELQGHINCLKTRCDSVRKPAKNAVLELLYWYQLQILLATKFILEKNFNAIIGLQTYGSRKRLEVTLKKINGYSINRQALISTRCDYKFKQLQHIRSVATELSPVIAGAVGENLVVKELKKLSGNYVLINDFSIAFEKPIYYKQKNSRIFSIQIDHLLITTAGIFIIETKNWSKESLVRLDLWSPLQQVQRANFALYTMLNDSKTKGSGLLREHHWGPKKIPIRNILAMIRHRPKEKFSYVAIKTLKELNAYIDHFDPIFNTTEIRRIADHLLRLNSEGL